MEFIKFVSKYAKEEEGLSCLTVNSSPYAVDFYRTRGFKDLGPETEADGIRFTPMELKL